MSHGHGPESALSANIDVRGVPAAEDLASTAHEDGVHGSPVEETVVQIDLGAVGHLEETLGGTFEMPVPEPDQSMDRDPGTTLSLTIPKVGVEDDEAGLILPNRVAPRKFEKSATAIIETTVEVPVDHDVLSPIQFFETIGGVLLRPLVHADLRISQPVEPAPGQDDRGKQ